MFRSFIVTSTLSGVILCVLPGSSPAAVCGGCHDPWLQKTQALAAQHSPFEDKDCASCHKDHGDSNKLVLTSAKTKLCLDCHDDPAAKGKVHSAIADGGCTDCHDPHASPNKKLLVKVGTALCNDCHDDPAAKGKVHSAIADGGCTDCHDPHSSPNKKLLVKAGAALCNECHEVPTKDEIPHTALEDGCTGCHDPHSSPQDKLLLKTYSNERYPKSYDLKAYALCFECHEATLVTGEGEVTGFRNSKTNLHNTHVMGDPKPNKYGIIVRSKPHSCGTCHSPHSSDQPFILIRKYDCGEVFCYTMNFNQEKDGGSCRVGCHKPMGYSRTGAGPTSAGGEIPVASGEGGTRIPTP